MGTHDELIDRDGGVYARLYALQAIGEDDASETTGAGSKEVSA